MMTRSERRALWRKAEKDSRAINCPDCGKKTFVVAVPVNAFTTEDPTDRQHLFCLVCNHYFGTVPPDLIPIVGNIADMSHWNKQDATERARAAIQSMMDTPIEEFEEVAYGEKSNGDAVEVPSVADALQSGVQAERVPSDSQDDDSSL